MLLQRPDHNLLSLQIRARSDSAQMAPAPREAPHWAPEESRGPASCTRTADRGVPGGPGRPGLHPSAGGGAGRLGGGATQRGGRPGGGAGDGHVCTQAPRGVRAVSPAASSEPRAARPAATAPPVAQRAGEWAPNVGSGSAGHIRGLGQRGERAPGLRRPRPAAPTLRSLGPVSPGVGVLTPVRSASPCGGGRCSCAGHCPLAGWGRCPLRWALSPVLGTVPLRGEGRCGRAEPGGQPGPGRRPAVINLWRGS